MSQYGNLPPEVLDIILPTIHDEHVSVRDLIEEEIKCPIIKTSHILEYNTEDEQYDIGRLTVWTESSIYLLICGPFGYFFREEER